MKVIIAGSRTVDSMQILLRAMEKCPFAYETTEVVSGGARGADALGEKWAKERNLPIKRFPAQWDSLGRMAGILRNVEMGAYADGLIALWDGKSKGTKHMIHVARSRGLPVYVENLRVEKITLSEEELRRRAIWDENFMKQTGDPPW